MNYVKVFVSTVNEEGIAEVPDDAQVVGYLIAPAQSGEGYQYSLVIVQPFIPVTTPIKHPEAEQPKVNIEEDGGKKLEEKIAEPPNDK